MITTTKRKPKTRAQVLIACRECGKDVTPHTIYVRWYIRDGLPTGMLLCGKCVKKYGTLKEQNSA